MTAKRHIFLTLILILLSAGCDQKPLYPVRKATRKAIVQPSGEKKSDSTNSPSENHPMNSDEKTAPKKKSDVGIADAADYATGYTPLKTRQFSKNRLQNSYKERVDNVDNALNK